MMANVQAASPIGQLPGSGGIGRRSSVPRSQYGSPNHYGSRPNSRVSFSDGSAKAHSRQNSGGRLPRPPSQPRGSPDGSSGRERPPSVRSLHERVEMSEFLSPAVKTAVRRWKRFHEEKVREKFKERRQSKKRHVQAVKVEKKKLARKIPIDVLALEWMNDNKVTVDARAFLLDKLLPTLIMGVEKLLMEVDKRNLAEETEVNPNFNPINYLAQYLMRNNPRYSNFPEASPYIRGLREVTDEIKNHVFSFDDNRLAKVKAEARKKREEQTKQEALRTKERLARSGRVREHFTDWILDEENEVETHIIHNALRDFKEVLDDFPPEKRTVLNVDAYLRPINKEKLEAAEFVEYLRDLITKMTPELFAELMTHMCHSARAYRRAAVLEARKDILMALFRTCDHASIGIIDRHRVLGLFKAFYDKQPWVSKRHIRNPRRWPVVELDEVGDDESSIAEESVISGSSRMSSSVVDSRPGTADQSPTPAEQIKEESAQEAKSQESVDKPQEEAAEPDQVPANEASKETVDNQQAPTTAAEEADEKPQDTTTAAGEDEDGAAQQVPDGEATDNELALNTKVSTDETKNTEKQDETKLSENEVDKPEKQVPIEESNEKMDETKSSENNVSKPEKKSIELAASDDTKPVEESKPVSIEPVAADDAKIVQESKPEPEQSTIEGGSTAAATAETVTETKHETGETGGTDQAGKTTAENTAANDVNEVAADSNLKEVADKAKDAPDASKEDQRGSEENKDEQIATQKVNKELKEGEIGEEAKGATQEPKEGESAENVQFSSQEPSKEPKERESVEKSEEVATEEGSAEVSKVENAQAGVNNETSAGEKTDEASAGGEKVNDKATVEEEKEKEEAQDTLEVEGAIGSHPQTATTGRATAVSFDEEAIASKEQKQALKSPVKTPTSRSGSVAASAFDQNTLNTSQFVALVDVFLGDDPPEEVVQAVVKFIQDGYVETEEEKFSRLQKARREEQLAKRKVMMDQLFDKWDNDGSGFLDLDELHSVMSKFKENMEKKIVAKAKKMLEKEELDHRLSKTEFKRYLQVVCSLLPGGEDNFDPLVEFLMTSVERSYEERIRGQARKKWLAQIQQAAETSGASMEPVYKSVFNSLYKDSEQHGRGKRISANISMLERNDTAPGRGPTCLRYVACTPDDAHFMLNKIMYKDMKGISFTSVDSGKPIHVPRVQNHGNIMFWNPERQEEDRQGSFIVIPLKDHRKRVFGTMGIDTLNDPQEKSIFITHEISFFQGVAKAFSSAFQYVDIRRKTLRIAESAVSWIHRRSPHVQEISVYIVEPDDKDFTVQRRPTLTRNRKMAKYIEDEVETIKMEDFILRRMLTTDKSGNIEIHDHPTRLERKENLFRDYLFRCVDNSETITADAYGQRHTAFPLRDIEGHCVALVDISIGDLKHLPSHENKEVQRMLKLLQYAHKEVSLESEGKDQKVVLEAEKNSEESRIDIMFDRIMLTDLRETVGKLNLRAFAELKSYKEPPKVIHDILASVLSLFYHEKAEEGELEEYHNCKQYVNPELIKKIEEFDPTALETVEIVNRIAARLKEVPHGAVAKHGSLPAQHLYNWVFVCLSLLEHTSKMKMNQKLPKTETPPPGSAMSGGITEQ